MTASKRKNDDSSLLQGMTEMVIVDVNNRSSNNSINVHAKGGDLEVFETVQRMKHLISLWRQQEDELKHKIIEDLNRSSSVGSGDSGGGVVEKDDPVAFAIRTIDAGVTGLEKTMVRESDRICTELDRQILQEKHLCNRVSFELSDLSEKLEQYNIQRSELLREIDDLDERQRISQVNIAEYIAEISQKLEDINDFDEKRKLQVPRLKMIVSLYASTTGIKWDFKEGTDILSGQVAVPSKLGFRRFSIDQRDHSSVETADYLWDLIEGSVH